MTNENNTIRKENKMKYIRQAANKKRSLVFCNWRRQFTGLLLAGFFWMFSGQELPAQTNPQYLFVSSRGNHSVKYYDGQTGAPLGDFVSTGSGGLNTAQEVLFNPAGNLIVSGRGNLNILEFNGETGDFIGPFTSGYDLDNPTKMTYGPDGDLYVSQWGVSKNKVARFDGGTGVFQEEFTEVGFGANNACGHAWDQDGNLYVATFASANVRKFDTTGADLGVFTEPGHLQGAVNVWFNNDQNLFVVDWTMGAVVQFDSNGDFVGDFITGMTNSEGFTFGSDGSIYICDWSQNRVNKYTSGGIFDMTFASGGGLSQPNSVLFGPPEDPSAIEPVGNTVPTKFELGQNFPNPFNPGTRIRFEIPQSNFVILKIYNGLGQEVATLVNENLPAGQYLTEWDAAKFPTGVYFYHLQAGAFFATKKLVLLR
jgi:hypothetical protein